MTKIQLIVNALEDVNASDIVVYDTKGKSPFYDYFVIASVTSDRQLQGAIAHVQDDLSKAKYQVARIEGKNSNSWVLIDSKDIIVNVFTKEERVYYNLEKMLVEIEQIKLEELKWYTRNLLYITTNL